jgi:hypothetical protein
MVDVEIVHQATLKLNEYVPLVSEGESDKTEPILRALLAFAPASGRAFVASKITACKDSEHLRELSNYFLTYLLKPSESVPSIYPFITRLCIVKWAGGRTPLSSLRPSRFAETTSLDDLRSQIETAKREQSALKQVVRFDYYLSESYQNDLFS